MRKILLLFVSIVSFAAFADQFRSFTYYYYNNSSSNTFNSRDAISESEAIAQFYEYLPLRLTSTGANQNYIFNSKPAYSNLTQNVGVTVNQTAAFFALSDLCGTLWLRGFETNKFETVTISTFTYVQKFRPFVYLSLALNSNDPQFRAEVSSRLADIVNQFPQLLSVLNRIDENLLYIHNDLYTVTSNVYDINQTLRTVYPYMQSFDELLRTYANLVDPSLTTSGLTPDQIYNRLGLSMSLGMTYQEASADPIARQQLSSNVDVRREQYRKAAELTDYGRGVYTDPDTGEQYTQSQLRNLSPGEINTLYSGHVGFTTNQAAKIASDVRSIYDNVERSDGRLGEIKDVLEGGLKVQVLNWPDELWNISVLSNAFAEALANLKLDVTNLTEIPYIVDDSRNHEGMVIGWRGYNLLEIPDGGFPLDDPDFTKVRLDVKGEFFHDIPNILMAQVYQGADACNFLSRLVSSALTNEQMVAESSDQERRYMSALDAVSDEMESSESEMFSHSNLLQSVHFVDTTDLLTLPKAFEDIAGDGRMPTHVNFQFPQFLIGTHDYGSHTLVINVSQHARIFSLVRNFFLLFYWALLVGVLWFLFLIFWRIIHLIPDNLCKAAEVR